ncbi:heat shock protein 75 kDa, mitochondrial-like, partial [Saccostrea cucullata]|uniref:heat shock protein 75 kDa, mitochondrial-like n=1 Tax=Saccostrea cuccullata TaxID=36930 RepID=UPI002ED665D3
MAASSYTCLLSTRRSCLASLRSYSRYSTVFQKYKIKQQGFVPVYQAQKLVPWTRSFSTSPYYFSTDNEQTVTAEPAEEEYHSLIKDTERAKGPLDHHEFQAETRKLLDIVARSLYSEKE